MNSYELECERRWLEHYHALRQFIEENGHDKLPRDFTDFSGCNIYAWRNSQKVRYKEGLLSNERIAWLEKLPYWRWQRRNRAKVKSWTWHLKALKKALDQGAPPKRHTTLGMWYSRQKNYYKNGTLSEERIKAFEDACIPIQAKARISWEESFQQLKEYGSIPKQTNPIGVWAYTQKYFKDKLSPERTAKLNSLPFWTWEVKPNGKVWKKSFQEFKDFVNEKKRFPKRREPLGSWFFKQRRRIKSGTMAEEQHKMLNSIPGWEW